MSPSDRAVKSRADGGHGAPPDPHPAASGWAVPARSYPSHDPERPGAFVIPFGKHVGKTLAQAPPDYVEWLARESKFPTVQAAARAFVGLDGEGPLADPDTAQVGEPDTGSAAVRLPLVVWEHEQALLAKFGADPGTAAGQVVLESRKILRDLCAKTTGREFPAEEGGVA